MKTMTKKQFGEWLKEIRLGSGMSQKQMANILSLNAPQQVSQIEVGDAKLPKHAYATMIQHFRLDREKFIDILMAVERGKIEAILTRNGDSSV